MTPPPRVPPVVVVCASLLQLDSLMDTLNSTQPHYVRCIKPNDSKRPDLFDANACLTQLRYAGVFQAVTIRQRGFPFRWPHEQFFKRYRACGDAANLFGRHIPADASYLSLSQKVCGWCVKVLAELFCKLFAVLRGCVTIVRTWALYEWASKCTLSGSRTVEWRRAYWIRRTQCDECALLDGCVSLASCCPVCQWRAPF